MEVLTHVLAKEGGVAEAQDARNLLDRLGGGTEIIGNVTERIFRNPLDGGLAGMTLADDGEILGGDAETLGKILHWLMLDLTVLQILQKTVEEIAPKETFRDTLHFASEENLVWPLEGNVLLDYSMDATIYFPTLDQYRCNPAIVIGGEVNSKVYLVAPGVITDISTNEVTGCTVTQDLGDGYSAVYGQLKELNFSVGDEVEGGQVIGYVSEPTKYYSVEGSNLYFELLKDGEPVNPLEYFE